ncbi:MAG: diaminopimelate decarboxylase [Fidelibacterota bacterium]
MHPLINTVNNKQPLLSVIEQYGSPVYIYSGEQIKKNLDKLDSALNQHFQKYHICYAVKANSNPHLLQLMKSHLPRLGADCSSPGEIHASKLGGMLPNECIYTGNYESPDDLKAALNAGVHLNLDDINSFYRLMKIGVPEEISFRLNPGFGKGSFSQIITGGKKAKFGVPHYDIINAYRIAKENGITKFGIQCMTGSGILDPAYFSELITAILKTVKAIHKELDIQMSFISMGGGLGIPYNDEESPLDFNRIFSGVSQIYNNHFEKENIVSPELWIEPGKSIIGDTCFLLTTVTGVKNSYQTFIGLDAGMEKFMRPVLYGAYHRIYKVGEPDAPIKLTADFTGQICENTDRLAVDRKFPSVQEGDLIAIMDAGAYGFSMSHNFNTRPRAAEVLLEGNQSRLIRKRETIEDIFRTCEI